MNLYAQLTSELQSVISELVQALSDRQDQSIDQICSKYFNHFETRIKDQEASQCLFDSQIQSALLALSTGDCATTDFNLVFDLLDAAQWAAEKSLCSDTITLRLLEMLFESESVDSAERLFDYVESRASKLVQTQRVAKSARTKTPLTLLRMCNELLKRLSKSTHTVFCGRILIFLSASFPLGDQSAVNLRGAYNTTNSTLLDEPIWDVAAQNRSKETADAEKEDDEGEIKDEATELPKKEVTPATDASAVTETTVPAEPDFYTLFWSLQRIFSFPPSLFKTENYFPDFVPPKPVLDTSSASTRSSHSSRSRPSNLPTRPGAPTPGGSAASTKPSLLFSLPNMIFFKFALDKVLRMIGDVNKRDRDLGGPSTSASRVVSKSQDRDVMDIDSTDVDAIKTHYFFPKFLTSRNLLDLELADASFRRQILVQILVTLAFLRGQSASEKERAQKLENLNKSLLQPITLSDTDLKWIADVSNRTYNHLRDTQPDGERFYLTIVTILSRDQHWINWKLASCKDFTLAPLDRATASEEGRAKKRRLMAPPRPFPFALGTPGLSKLWNSSKDPLDISDLEHREPAKGIDYFRAGMQEALAEQRAREAVLASELGATPTQRQLTADSEWQFANDRKSSMAWRALRLIVDEDLSYFGRIQKGNVVELFDLIDAAKLEAEQKEAKKTAESVPPSPVTPALLEAATSNNMERQESDEIKSEDVDMNAGDAQIATDETAVQAQPGTTGEALEVDQLDDNAEQSPNPPRSRTISPEPASEDVPEVEGVVEEEGEALEVATELQAVVAMETE